MIAWAMAKLGLGKLQLIVAGVGLVAMLGLAAGLTYFKLRTETLSAEKALIEQQLERSVAANKTLTDRIQEVSRANEAADKVAEGLRDRIADLGQFHQKIDGMIDNARRNANRGSCDRVPLRADELLVLERLHLLRPAQAGDGGPVRSSP